MSNNDEPQVIEYRRPFDYWLLWVLVIVSLVVNAVLIRIMLDLQATAQSLMADAATGALAVADGVLSVREAVFEYNVEIDESIPVEFDVPVQFTVPVVIDETIPVNTSVATRIPVLNLPINVPISTNIPVQLEIDVEIDQTIEIRESVPVRFTVPVVIAVAETPFATELDNAYDGLVGLAEDLASGDGNLGDAPAANPAATEGTSP